MSWQDAASQMKMEVSYPFIQWINDGGIISPRQHSGGFAMPESEAAIAGDHPKGASRAMARFRTADESVFFTQQIRAAVLAVQFAWVKDGIVIPSYVEGARGKARALSLVEGESGSFLAIMTFSGLASRDFLNAYKEHRARVRKGTRAAGKEAPASIFYLTMRAGESQRMSQGSIRTPIVLSGDFDPDRDYIGDQALRDINWDEVRAWETRTVVGENGDEPEPEPKVEDMPF